MIRRALPLALVLSLLGFSAPIVSAQSAAPATDPQVSLQQLADAFSRNDHAAAINMFTDDAIVVGGPCSDAPGGECVGRSQIAAAVNAQNEPFSVSLVDLNVQGDGNVVTFKTNEAFEFPPEAAAAGVQRMVETGTAVLQDGKVDRLALVVDVTDPQTVTLQHIFASLEPQSGPTDHTGQ